MKRIILMLLAGCAFFAMADMTPGATYVTDEGATNLGYQTVASISDGLDGSFDNVLFTAQINGASSFTMLDLSLAADGIGLGNFAVLSGAAFLNTGGIAPSSIQLNLLNAIPGDFYQATFNFASLALTPGTTSNILVLQFPLNSIAPFLNSTPFVLSSANQGPPAASTISAVGVPEPDSLLLLLMGMLGLFGRRRST